ncbi:hypothetical protein D9758_012598 [Tetrapyrgos nigripes]|uniref:Uncharacterized protein n=1 Tax=Tetrapyrgos nigripes TaxID=182062 RepID=A0A8H5GE34_9AGAR|nr:hypothetical protein D9758_012598 [Tetrapyrgos nigripes]
MTFPDFFIRVALAIRQVTIYNQIKRSQDQVDPAKVALQLKELSESRVRSLSILVAVLVPLTRLPSVVPAAWVIFLFLLSMTAAALCDRIHPDQLSTLSPGLFTLMHSIPGLCVCGVLLAAMIRFSENKTVAIVQLLVFGAFALVVLLSLKTDEEIPAVDEERAAGSGFAIAGVGQSVPESANTRTDGVISGGVRPRMTVTASSHAHTTLTPTTAATSSPSDSYPTPSYPGVVDGASARNTSPTASAAVASSASNAVLSNKSANNPSSSPSATPKTASGAAIIASSSAPWPSPSASTTIVANETSSSRPIVTTPSIVVPAPAKLRARVQL